MAPSSMEKPESSSVEPNVDTSSEKEVTSVTKDDVKAVDANSSMEEDMKTGRFMVQQGFSSFKQGNFDEAIEFLSEGLALMVKHVDQLSEALGPIYLAYGRALMQVAIRNVNAMLVNQAKVPVQAAQEENDSNVQDGKKMIHLPDIIQSGEEEDDEEGEEEEGEGVTAESVEDDFQLAWEIFDVARLIYSKDSSNPKSRQVLADIHVDLGDLQMENDQFLPALGDYQRALEILEEECAGEGRMEEVEGRRARASVQFKIALAHEYNEEAGKAVEPLSSALSHLRSIPADADISDLIQELALKLADIQASLSKAETMRSKIVVEASAGSGGEFRAAEGPVNDLSGLVKKRKAPAVTESDLGEDAAKKSKTE